MDLDAGKATAPMPFEGPGKRPPTVFFLVHGTWAPGADWTLPGHPLTERLTGRFAPRGGCEIRKLVWRGWWGRHNNSHRHPAGDRLAEEIRALLEERPETLVFVVGHSHGGNVALYADRQLKAGSIAGIACLSTPFIRAVPRSSWGLGVGLALGFFLAFAVLALLVNYGGRSVIAEIGRPGLYSKRGLPSEAVAALSLALFVALRFGAARLAERGAGRIREALERRFDVAERLSIPPCDERRCFVAGTAWDEAVAGIVPLWFLQRLPHALLGSPVLVALFAALWPAFVFRLGVSADPTGPAGWCWIVLYAGLLALLALGAFSAIVATFASVVSVALTSASFGVHDLVTHALVDVSITKAPPGVFRWRGYVSEGPGLVHSRLYGDERLIADLVDWLERRAATIREAERRILSQPTPEVRL